MKVFIPLFVLLVCHVSDVYLQRTTMTQDQSCHSYTFMVPPGEMCNCDSLQREVDELTTKVEMLEASVNIGGLSTAVPIYQDCQDLLSDRNTKHESGIYLVQPQDAPKPFHVWCELEVTGASTVIQRQKDGLISFNRDWDEYKNGFGRLDSEFWLGNEQIYQITNQGQYKLYIEMEDWEGNVGYAKYNMFEVGDESDKYRLDIDGYVGNIGDSLTHHDGQQFSTFDQDNDSSGHENCASAHDAGWWYRACHWSNLNGLYYTGGRYVYRTYAKGIEWKTWKNTYGYSMKTVTMKLQRKPDN